MGGVIFCAVVPQVGLACGLEESQLSLRFSAADPVEVHFHGLGFEWNDGLVGHAYVC